VLVFVAGMGDITELYSLLEESNSSSSTSTRNGHANKKLKIYVIHRDVPLEEQEEAFTPAANDEIKVILATNAAESSITIPDIDVVLDMGVHKSMHFDESRHRAYLRYGMFMYLMYGDVWVYVGIYGYICLYMLVIVIFIYHIKCIYFIKQI
jgi:HrpA-like RNA helicase